MAVSSRCYVFSLEDHARLNHYISHKKKLQKLAEVLLMQNVVIPRGINNSREIEHCPVQLNDYIQSNIFDNMSSSEYS